MKRFGRSVAWGAALAALLVLLAAPGGRAADKRPKHANINRAAASFALGEFEEADAIAAAVLEDEPENFRALALRGRIAVLGNRLADAEDLLERALAVTPTHRETQALLAEALYRQDRFADAAPILEAIAEEAKAAKLAAFADRRPYLTQPKRTVVPFLQTDPLPVVELSINGSEPADFLLDTGSGELILDREWATELGIEVAGTSRGTFGGDLEGDVDHGHVRTVGLGDLTVRNVPVQMLDTSPFSAIAPQREIRGVLGTIFLYHFLATIDYPGARLVLEPRGTGPAEAEPAEGTVRIPFWLAGDHLIVARGRVNDADPLLFLVDTGLAGAAFTCPKSTLKEAGVELIPQASAKGVGGAGSVSVVPFLLERLRLGSLERAQMPGLFGPFPDSLGQGKGFRIGGLVSHAFFRPYALTFDFDAMEILVSGAD